MEARLLRVLCKKSVSYVKKQEKMNDMAEMWILEDTRSVCSAQLFLSFSALGEKIGKHENKSMAKTSKECFQIELC